MLPGISPGKTAFGKASFCAFAPSRTGGSFTNVSSSLGNLKPFFLKASPKSFSSGKLLWQVLHEVWYLREKAGIAFAGGEAKVIRKSSDPIPKAVVRDPTRTFRPAFITTSGSDCPADAPN